MERCDSMPNTIYSLDGYSKRQSLDPVNQFNTAHHFPCDPVVSGPLRMKMESYSNHPHSVFALTTWTRHAYRRTRSHIRQDPSQFYSLTYVEHGSIKVSQAGQTLVVETGSCALIPTYEPLVIECDPGDGVLRTVYSLWPAHKIKHFFPNLDQMCALRLEGDRTKAAMEMLLILYGDGCSLDRSAFQLLSDAMLTQLAASSKEENLRLTIGDKRLEQVKDYLEQNLSRPGLNLSHVSGDLNLSVRYITRLFQCRQMSFERTLWAMRLDLVRKWLEMPELIDQSISEMAYLAGFRSVPHLSRLFHERYGISPRRYRQLTPPASTSRD